MGSCWMGGKGFTYAGSTQMGCKEEGMCVSGSGGGGMEEPWERAGEFRCGR